MTDREKIELLFKDYVSRSTRNFTKVEKALADELVAKGYARYILDGDHVEFIKYPSNEN